MSIWDIIDKNLKKSKKGTWGRIILMQPPGAPGGNGGIHTGYGPDGRPQPNMPAMMDMNTNPPTVVHEDERVTPIPGGKHVTPSPMTPPGMAPGPMPNTVVPTTPQAQQNMKRMEMMQGLPGRQTGGAYYENTAGGSGSPTTYTLTPPTQQTVQNVQPVGGSTSGPAPTYNVSAPQTSTNAVQPAPAPAPTLGPTAATTPYQQGQAAGYEQIRQVAQGTDPYMANVTNRTMQQYDATQAANTTAGAQRMAQQPGMTAGAKNLAVATLGRDSAIGRSNLAGQLAETQTNRMYTAAQDSVNMGRTATQDDINRQQWQQEFDFSKQKYGDSKAWTDFEYTAQYGSDADVMAAYKLATGRDLDPSAVAEIRGYARTVRGQTVAAGDIANDAAALNLSTAQMQAMISDINNGVPLDAINGRYGVNLRTDQYNSIATKYKQSVRSGDLTLQSLETRITGEKLQTVQDLINKGYSRERINQEIPGINLTDAEYRAALDATPLGERNYGRTLSAANMLLASGDPKNIQQASEMYGELFPGVSFSVDQLIGDIGADRFAQGMTSIATLANTFDTWEEATSSVKGLDLLDSMGIDEATAQQMFQGLKVNAIDEQWDAIESSAWYKKLLETDPERASLLQEVFTAGLTGELVLDVVEEFTVTDESGKTVKKVGSQEEADAFIAENPDKGYVSTTTSRLTMRDPVTGETAGASGGTPPSPQTQIEKDFDVVSSLTGAKNVSSSLVQIFKEDSGGALPEDLTETQWNTWYDTKGKYLDIITSTGESGGNFLSVPNTDLAKIAELIKTGQIPESMLGTVYAGPITDYNRVGSDPAWEQANKGKLVYIKTPDRTYPDGTTYPGLDGYFIVGSRVKRKGAAGDTWLELTNVATGELFRMYPVYK